VEDLRREAGLIREQLWNLKEAERLEDRSAVRKLIEDVVARVTVNWRCKPWGKYTRRPVTGGRVYLSKAFGEYLGVQNGSW
jgi:hypothetical protein